VGIPPFETNSLEETYQRIRTGTFYIPGHVSMAARTLIQRMLCVDPQKRMSIDRALNDKFFHGYMPKTVFPLVDHTEGQVRKSLRVDRLINGQARDKERGEKARRRRQHGEDGGMGGEVSDITRRPSSTNTSRGDERVDDDGGRGHQVSDKSEEEHSSDENKENENKMGITANNTNLSTTRNDTCIDDRADGNNKERRTSDGMSVMPWDVCMSFVDKSVAIDSTGIDSMNQGGRVFPFPQSIPQHKSDDESTQHSPHTSASDLDIKEEIARYESTHKSAFTSVTRGGRGNMRGGRRRAIASAALQMANRPRMEDICEVSGSYGPSSLQNSLPDCETMPQSLMRSVRKYDAVWRTPDLEPAQDDEQEDDVMTEEEERAAMQHVQQQENNVRRRRSSVAKMVLCSLPEREDSSENSSPSPPRARASLTKRRDAAHILPPARRNGSHVINFNYNDDDDDVDHADVFSSAAVTSERGKPRVVRASSLKLQSFDLPPTSSPTKPVTFDLPASVTHSSHVQPFEMHASLTSLAQHGSSNGYHVTTVVDTVNADTPDTSSASTAHRFPKEKWDKLRKTRSVTSLPTQTLEQVLGQLCADPLPKRRHATIIPPHLTGISSATGSAHQSMEQHPWSAYQSPADTPTTSARASPTPFRKKKSPAETPITSARTSPVMRRKKSHEETPPTTSAMASPVNHRKVSPATPTSSRRGSPAPVRRKKSTKTDKQRRHTSLGIEGIPVVIDERTVAAPVTLPASVTLPAPVTLSAPVTPPDDSMFARQSSVASESEAEVSPRRSASVAPSDERRRKKSRHKIAKNASIEVKVTDVDDFIDTPVTAVDAGEKEDEEDNMVSSLRSPATPPETNPHILRHSQTVAEFSSVDT
jgi:hypothetical protein